MNTFQKLLTPFFRIMAKQLRQPSGMLAKLAGKKMNDANKLMYEATFQQLQVSDGHRILEIGFGNGKYFSHWQNKAKGLQLFGVDPSHEMLTEAVKKNASMIENGSLKLLSVRSDALPFEDNSFDIIYCINVIYFWENPLIHLNEIKRVLKPGGQLCTTFRPLEYMQTQPFAAFGFTLYSVKDWSIMLEQANLLLEKVPEEEPTPINTNEPPSYVCMLVRKK